MHASKISINVIWQEFLPLFFMKVPPLQPSLIVIFASRLIKWHGLTTDVPRFSDQLEHVVYWQYSTLISLVIIMLFFS